MSKTKTLKVEAKTRIYLTIGDEAVSIDRDDVYNLRDFLFEQGENDDHMTIEGETE